MTSEDDFQAALDADPTDWQTRLVFADWLQERGDERADGYRALGLTRRVPYRVPEHFREKWLYGLIKNLHWRRSRAASVTITVGRRRQMRYAAVAYTLPESWVRGFARPDRKGWVIRQTPTRRAIEDAAARAFANLPADTRARILAARDAA